MSKLLSCPQCKSNNLSHYVSNDNVSFMGEVKDWIVKCRDCSFNIDCLSKNGTEQSAVSDWNNLVSEILILDYLNTSEDSILSFDGGINILSFIESHNYTERRLKIDLNKLAKEYKIDKNEFTNHDIEFIPIGKKYQSYQINEHGRDCLKRLKRNRNIKTLSQQKLQ